MNIYPGHRRHLIVGLDNGIHGSIKRRPGLQEHELDDEEVLDGFSAEFRY